MKAIMKGLIAGIVIILVGVALLIGAIALNGWRWPFHVEYETREWQSTGELRALDVTVNYGELKTQFYEGDCVKIVYPYADQYPSDISEENGTVSFANQSVKWYQFGIWATDMPQITLFLPQDSVPKLSVEVRAGSCTIAAGAYGDVEAEVKAGVLQIGDIVCSSLQCEVKAGTLKIDKVECSSLRCEVSAGLLDIAAADCSSLLCEVSAGKLAVRNVVSPTISAEVSAGSLELAVKGDVGEYTIRKNVSAGSCNLENRVGTTDKTITVEVSAGSASVTFTDN